MRGKSTITKGVTISFEHRFIGGGLIFLIGSQFIYYGMRFNGSARLKGPVWNLVSGLHNMIVYSVLTVALCGVALFVLVPLVSLFARIKEPKELMPLKEIPLPPVVLSPEQIEQRRLRYERMQKEAHEFKEQERKRIEEKQKLEEQKKQEAIKARRERSAEDAVRAGLDDFL